MRLSDNQLFCLPWFIFISFQFDSHFIFADNVVKLLVPQEDADERSAIIEIRAGTVYRFMSIESRFVFVGFLFIGTRIQFDFEKIVLSRHFVIITGTGGLEASLFAQELFKMYENFAASQGWQFEVMSCTESDVGGYRVRCLLLFWISFVCQLRCEWNVDCEHSFFLLSNFHFMSTFLISLHKLIDLLFTRPPHPYSHKHLVFPSQECSAMVTGAGVFGKLKHESGVHRVQRIPATDPARRIHTSTATLAILPEAEEVR